MELKKQPITEQAPSGENDLELLSEQLSIAESERRQLYDFFNAFIQNRKHKAKLGDEWYLVLGGIREALLAKNVERSRLYQRVRRLTADAEVP